MIYKMCSAVLQLKVSLHNKVKTLLFLFWRNNFSLFILPWNLASFSFLEILLQEFAERGMLNVFVILCFTFNSFHLIQCRQTHSPQVYCKDLWLTHTLYIVLVLCLFAPCYKCNSVRVELAGTDKGLASINYPEGIKLRPWERGHWERRHLDKLGQEEWDNGSYVN